ncbi:MAG: DUF2147 domain-containing protein [Arcicella sp.]|jgi:uncharacterized protein (DUF2147 family)|nr:DUF2147 domain-containing protein [Arcicella sp.]
MKKIFVLLIIAISFVNISVAQSVTKDAVVGEWLSEDKDGRVLIYKQGEKFFGKVVWGKDGGRKDVNNPDEKLREQNIIGSVILKNFEFTGKAWENGTIYDPNNGKTYSCTMKVKKANELEIRGFIGISLLGRTTVWTKVK